MPSSTISVADMHCASCVGKVQQALAAVEGVAATHVNPARRQLLVEHAAHVDPVALLQRIEDAGFHPSLSRIETGNREQRDLLRRLGVAGLGMMQVMMFSIALYAGGFDGMEEAYRRLLQLASLAFCLPVVAYSAVPFFKSALASLRQGLNMDVPIALAIAAAFTVSLAATLTGEGEVYYDSVVMFTFLLLGARYVDDRLKVRFDNANHALAALPQQALLLDDDGSVRPVALAEVAPVSRLWVEQGNRVPLDGDVVRGQALVDESALTGESVPVTRLAGQQVFAGTLNRGPGFELRTARTAEHTRIAGIAELADRAQAHKPALARLADRIAGVFVPAVLALAAATWLGWQLVDPTRAFVAALTVLVVSCPCALSLATPAAFTAAMTRLRQNGVVLTRSEALQQLARVDAAILDKTGTLTVHDPVITRIDWLVDGAERAALGKAAAALERHANHPLARAMQQAFPGADPNLAEDVRVVPGAGVEGRVLGRRLRLGRADFCGQPDDDPAAVLLCADGRLAARFHVSDAVRADARDVVDGLKQAGIAVTMVSGDAPERCAALAAELGIDFVSRQSPETKLAITRRLQQAGHTVLVVGDGINDVPALAAADVSATVLESSDLVKSRADVLLLSRRLGALVESVAIGRRTRTTVRQNLTWALVYNLLAVPLAALGFMPPWLAALGMASSSMLVMGNAARLLTAGHSTSNVPAPAGTQLQPAT